MNSENRINHAMGSYFDDYVERVFPERRERQAADWKWPGDEWVDEGIREATYRRLTHGLDPATVGQVVEIGPGSGKYTELLLERTTARVVAYEISEAFIACLQERCAHFVHAERLRMHHIAWTDNRALLQTRDTSGSADLFFGIDVFLMMDFQSVLTYLVSAAAMLGTGGRFFGTFGDGISESGWQRMLRDVGRHSAFDSSPSTRFHWIDARMIENALIRLGFEDIEIESGPASDLDIARLYVGATLARPMTAERALDFLSPSGGSTNRAARSAPPR